MAVSKPAKMPAFQFYPSDWRSDPGIQCLSFEDRGIWFEILCLMHESPRRGVLLLPNGTPMSSVALGRVIGLPTPKMVKALDRISAVGVSDREEWTGALMNRRMVRDEHIRRVRAECGSLGGNPNWVNQNGSKVEAKDEHVSKLNSTPSSSSSSSSSSSKQSPPQSPHGAVAGPDILCEIWNEERGNMPECKRFTPERREKARVRLETQQQNATFLEDFRLAVRRAGENQFMCGGGSQGWVATFDWFLKNNTNYVKVLEGRYDGNKGERESEAQAKQRRTREASGQLLRLVDEQASGGIPAGNIDRDTGDVPAVVIGFTAGPAKPSV